jgi:UDP-N-acetylmuramate--alanine ligase
VDPDHLDIYGDEAEFKAAFNTFVNGLEEEGTVFRFKEIPEFETTASQFSYGMAPSDFEVSNVHVNEGAFHFDLKTPERYIQDISLPLPGRHNVWNAAAACAVAVKLDLGESLIKKALKAYRGVKRRFEVHQAGPEVYFIDDYAHHPTEIKACIQAVRELYPGKHLTVAFQPHLFSRTRDFLSGFAKSLSLADELILLPIYPAREKPIPGITSEALLELTTVTNTVMCTKEELPSYIAGLELEVLLVLGAGDIDRTIPLINSVLSKRNQNL